VIFVWILADSPHPVKPVLIGGLRPEVRPEDGNCREYSCGRKYGQVPQFILVILSEAKHPDFFEILRSLHCLRMTNRSSLKGRAEKKKLFWQPHYERGLGSLRL
jgi:hypothetical protein